MNITFQLPLRLFTNFIILPTNRIIVTSKICPHIIPPINLINFFSNFLQHISHSKKKCSGRYVLSIKFGARTKQQINILKFTNYGLQSVNNFHHDIRSFHARIGKCVVDVKAENGQIIPSIMRFVCTFENFDYCAENLDLHRIHQINKQKLGWNVRITFREFTNILENVFWKFM